MSFVSEELGDDHDLARFDSGKPELDRCLRQFARHAAASRTGRTFVWHAGDGVVVAYYTLAAHEVAKTDLPKGVGRGGPDRVAAVLLARLALDRGLHGQSLGAHLLADGFSRILEASMKVAIRVVTVDAVDAAPAAFYERFGLPRSRSTRIGCSRRSATSRRRTSRTDGLACRGCSRVHR